MKYIVLFFLLIIHVIYGSAPVERGRMIGKLDLGYLPMAIARQGTVVYVADFDNAALNLYDISDPKNIHYLKSMSVGHGTITDLHIDHQRMYVAQGSEGVAIVDISDPRNPRVVQTSETGREYWDIFGKSLKDRDYSIGDEYVYAVDNKGGVVDIFDQNLHRVKSITIPASERQVKVFVEENFVIGSDRVMRLSGRYLFVTGEETGLIVYYFNGTGFDDMHKIYENSNEGLLNGVRTNSSLTIHGADDEEHIFNAAHLGIDPDPLIVFGTQTYKLTVYARYKDQKLDAGGTIEEIKDGDLSINTFGYVSNNYRDFVAGSYQFGIFEYTGGSYTLKKFLKTDCDGSFVADGKELICANKSSKALEIYTLEKRQKNQRFVPVMIDDFMTIVPIKQ